MPQLLLNIPDNIHHSLKKIQISRLHDAIRKRPAAKSASLHNIIIEALHGFTGIDLPKPEPTPSLKTKRRKLYANSRSGIRGITQLSSGCWKAQIRLSAKTKYLGIYPTSSEASAAYEAELKRQST
jgi:hypothetical protein